MPLYLFILFIYLYLFIHLHRFLAFVLWLSHSAAVIKLKRQRRSGNLQLMYSKECVSICCCGWLHRLFFQVCWSWDLSDLTETNENSWNTSSQLVSICPNLMQTSALILKSYLDLKSHLLYCKSSSFSRETLVSCLKHVSLLNVGRFKFVVLSFENKIFKNKF